MPLLTENKKEDDIPKYAKKTKINWCIAPKYLYRKKLLETKKTQSTKILKNEIQYLGALHLTPIVGIETFKQIFSGSAAICLACNCEFMFLKVNLKAL